MKKALLLITFMIIFALTAFAQIDVTVAGSAEMTFGINLDDQFAEGDPDAVATGITNSSSASISFTLVSGTSEKGAEDDGVHGYIKIGEWKASATSDDGMSVTAGSVEAKIIFDMGYVNILSAATSTDFMAPLEDDDGDDDDDDVGVSTGLDSSGGFTIGLNVAPATIEIGVFSENDWTNDGADDPVWDWDDDDDNDETAPVWVLTNADDTVDSDDSNAANNYGAHVKIALDVAPAMIELAVVMGLYADAPMGVGVKATVDIDPINLYVVSDIAVDGGVTTMEFGGGLSASLADMVSLAVDATYGADLADNLDMTVSLSKGSAILPEMALSLALVLNNLDVADSMFWSAEVSASYTTPTLKPYMTFAVEDGDPMPMELNIGVEMYLITNVTFVLDWATGDLGNENGIITFATKISY